MANPLPRPPSIHPITGSDYLIEDAWQRWFNEIYNLIGATLVSAPSTSTYIIQTSDAILTNAQILANLSSGVVKVTTATGVLSSVAILDVASGGTGSSTSTGTGSNVLSTNPTIITATLTSPTMTAPMLGNVGSGNLGNCVGYNFSNLVGVAAPNQINVTSLDTYAYTFAGGV